MRIIRKFWDPKDPAFNLKVTAAALVSLCTIITAAALGFAYRVSAAGVNRMDHFLPTASISTEPLPTPTVPVHSEPVPPSAEVIALQEDLAAAEAERDALRTQLTAAEANADRLQKELDALLTEQGTVYTLLIRLERSGTFPGTAEVITFTRTVDQETYEYWEPGDVITDHEGFLTLPSDSLFHDWTVVLEDKCVTTDAG